MTIGTLTQFCPDMLYLYVDILHIKNELIYLNVENDVVTYYLPCDSVTDRHGRSRKRDYTDIEVLAKKYKGHVLPSSLGGNQGLVNKIHPRIKRKIIGEPVRFEQTCFDPQFISSDLPIFLQIRGKRPEVYLTANLYA